MNHRKALVLCLVPVLISTSACFSRRQPSIAETNQSAALVSATPTTAPATAAPETESADQSQPAPETPVEDMTVGTVEDAAGIDRYRVHILIDSEGAARDSDVQIDGVYIKEPPAEELTVQFQEGGKLVR